MSDPTLYFDHAASTPVRPEARAAMARLLDEGTANASSPHGPGRAARAALEGARERVAAMLGASTREIFFTSGGTEADNIAVLGRWRAHGGGVVVSAVEHSAVRSPSLVAAREGARLTVLAADGEGRVDPGALDEALADDPAVVSVMWGNNEVGTLQPVAEIADRCGDRGVVFHTDAVQAVGHVPVRLDEVGCALLSLSAHKFGGPTGVGALYVRRGTAVTPLLTGGGQERGLRPGTANVLGAVGLAAALETAVSELPQKQPRLTAMRDRLEARLGGMEGVHVNGSGADRLPHILSLGISDVPADVLVASLDVAGLAVSSGSACHSGAGEPSHVLVAMGRTSDAVVRFSLGWSTTEAEVDRAATLFADILERAVKAVA